MLSGAGFATRIKKLVGAKGNSEKRDATNKYFERNALGAGDWLFARSASGGECVGLRDDGDGCAGKNCRPGRCLRAGSLRAWRIQRKSAGRTVNFSGKSCRRLQCSR